MFVFAAFGDGVKTHFIPEAIANEIVNELKDRFNTECKIYDTRESAWIDMPGMIMVDRTIEKFDLGDGSGFNFPTEDFDIIYERLKSAETRYTKDTGTCYYKVHGWIQCVVLTSVQRRVLLKQLDAQSHDLKAKALAQKLEFTRRLNEVNKGLSENGDKIQFMSQKSVSIPKDMN